MRRNGRPPRAGTSPQTPPAPLSPLWGIFSRAKNAAAITRALGQAEIQTVTEALGSRVMVRHTGSRYKPNSRDLYDQCAVTSMIIDADGCPPRVISMLPSSPIKVTNRNIAHLRANMTDASTTLLDDGTTIGLYWFNGHWNIRTKKGYEVNDLIYESSALESGNATFGDILGSVMAKYPRFSLDRLARNKCYTIGFKDTRFHPFLEGRADPIVRAWFIQSVDLDRVNAQHGHLAGAVSWDDSIGLPLQATTRTAPLAELEADAALALDQFVATGHVNYGYMIHVGGQSFMMQSSLYSFISSVFYVDAVRYGDPKTPQWMLLEAILRDETGATSTLLTVLFPQCAAIVTKIEATIGAIAQAAVDGAHTGRIGILAKQFGEIWAHRYGASIQPDGAASIAQMMHHPRYALALYDVVVGAN